MNVLDDEMLAEQLNEAEESVATSRTKAANESMCLAAVTLGCILMVALFAGADSLGELLLSLVGMIVIGVFVVTCIRDAVRARLEHAEHLARATHLRTLLDR